MKATNSLQVLNSDLFHTSVYVYQKRKYDADKASKCVSYSLQKSTFIAYYCLNQHKPLFIRAENILFKSLPLKLYPPHKTT